MQTFVLFSSMLLSCVAVLPLRAAFDGPFTPANWSLSNSNANGSVDLSAAPAQVRVIGPNNFSYLPGLTEWSITVTSATTLRFDWSYFTTDDDSGPFDRAGWRQNQTRVELSRNNSQTRSGSVAVNLAAGDKFAFWVSSSDNAVAPGELTIRNFTNGIKAPKFRCATLSSNVVSLDFETISGRTYRLEATPSIPATNWVSFTAPFVASSSNTVVTAVVTNSSYKFFRAVLLP